ncbi:hypothetical protein H312_02686 [Anncaliia algerae PRA339]|uniref:Uncharacterized protein n=1 Tax=Anncaliia algerae PRA339 TaxID=1288291 RepID=A0A059EYX3_9MICR|nr:hypothetical protein H312_02686 [Anncaliia algerae PRA339]
MFCEMHKLIQKTTNPCPYMLSIIKIILIYTCMINLFPKHKLVQNLSKRTKCTPKFKRCIFILFDGLRPDGYFRTKKEGNYFNNFDEIKTSFNFISMCENPTLTALRLYSMFTGKKSSFLESLFAFNHNKKENNFFDEFNLIYGGDETIKDIFGAEGETYNAYGNNFDIQKEYRTIINLIKQSKLPIKDNFPELFVFHFSAIDAFGHKGIGIHDKRIQSACRIYNKMIEILVKGLDNDSFIVLTSDHGVKENGDHGGSSMEELTSFCSFIFNQENYEKLTVKNPKNASKIDDYYELNNDYEVISQNNIINTIFALLGCRYPKFTSGSIINWMTSKKNYLSLLINKMGMIPNLKQFLAKTRIVIEKENQSFHKNNKNLTKFLQSLEEKIDKELHQPINYALIIFVIICLLMLSKIFKDVFCIFLLFMVSHSVHSFLHEDLFFSFFTTKNILLNLLILAVSNTPQQEYDRIALFKIENIYFHILIIIVLNYNYKFIKKTYEYKKQLIISSFLNIKEYLISSFCELIHEFKIKRLDLHLIVILLRMILNLFNRDLPRETKLTYLIESMDPMVFLYTINQPIRCYFVYHLYKSTCVNAEMLYYSIVFLMGINWSLNLSLDICYFFSDEFEFFTSALLVFLTYFYPRLRLKINYNLEVIHFIITVAVSLVTYDQMIFHWFFAGRTMLQGVFVTCALFKQLFFNYMNLEQAKCF